MIWTEKDINILINNYQSTSLKNLSLILNRDENSIWHKAKSLRLTKSLDKWSKSDIDFLINNYENNGIEYICKNIQKTKDSVQYYVKKYHLSINKGIKKERVLSKLYNRNPNSFRVNPNQFFNIEKQEIAYILGILWADGFLYDNKISLSLIKEDGDKLIDVFSKTGNWKIKYKQPLNRKQIINFSVYNRIIYEFLLKNDYKNKGFHNFEKMLKTIPNDLRHYFFRGYFDGDGTIFMKNGQYILNITSSYNQDWTSLENIMKELGIKYSIKRFEIINKLDKINKYSRIIITNKNGIISFCKYIYKNYEIDNIGLKRKYDTFINIKKTSKNG